MTDPAELFPVPRRVLVVEDEANQRNMLRRAIREMEFEVEVAASGEEALKVIAQGEVPPTIALLDLNLPGMSGLELAAELQKCSPATRLIVLTGYGDLDTAREAMRCDVIDFLLKPCPLGELEAALSRALRKAGEAAQPDLIPLREPLSASTQTQDGETPRNLDDAERDLIAQALDRHGGNRTAAAHELGISVRTLYYRLSRYAVEDRFRE